MYVCVEARHKQVQPGFRFLFRHSPFQVHSAFQQVADPKPQTATKHFEECKEFPAEGSDVASFSQQQRLLPRQYRPQSTRGRNARVTFNDPIWPPILDKSHKIEHYLVTLTYFSLCWALTWQINTLHGKKKPSCVGVYRQIMSTSAGQSWACCLNSGPYRCRFTCNHGRGCPTCRHPTGQQRLPVLWGFFFYVTVTI